MFLPGRLYRTLSYVKFSQLWYRIIRRLQKPVSRIVDCHQIRTQRVSWRLLVPKTSAVVSEDEYCFLNETRSIVEKTIWRDPLIDRLWLYHLHYFDSLCAPYSPGKTEKDAALIGRWILENPVGSACAWDAYPLSLRIVNWIKWCLFGNTPTEAMLKSLLDQVSILSQQIEYHLLANHLFANGKALIFSGLFFEGAQAESWLAQGVAILTKEVHEQIGSDGGHFELSPMYHSIVLNDLLDIIQLGQVYHYGFPVVWQKKAAEMLSWLEKMIHPEGDIAYFNDAVMGQAPSFALLKSAANTLGISFDGMSEGLMQLRSSGYCRITQGPLVLIMDVGSVGASYQPGHAHADTLSFEMSLGAQRVFVNSGTSHYGNDLLRHYERSTAAHNTVSVDAENSSEVWHNFRVGARANIKTMRAEHDKVSFSVTASHDGFSKGIQHKRHWRINDNTLTLIDTLFGEGESIINQHFHLYPRLEIQVSKETLYDISGINGFLVSIHFDDKVRVTARQSQYAHYFGCLEENTKLITELTTILPVTLTTRIVWSS